VVTRAEWILIGGAAAGAFLLMGGARKVARVLQATEAARRDALTPDTRAAWDTLRQLAAERGIELYLGDTIRDDAAQRAAFESGASTISTRGWHHTGRALDFRVIDPANGQVDRAGKRVDLYREVARLAEGLGFRQIGFNLDGSVRKLKRADGSTFSDLGHLEYRDGRTLEVALAEYAELEQQGVV